MLDNTAYWIWLQNAFGAGSPIPWNIFTRLAGGVEEFHSGGIRLWNKMKFISDGHISALADFTPEEAQARLEYVNMRGWEALTPQSEKYPTALRNISNPPAVLYVKGEFPDVDSRPSIAVAGSRRPTEDSLTAASKFGYQLAAGGAVVISGGAVGVDANALLGAMSAAGRMISVLPVDLDSPYIADNAVLRRSISERGGALVTEYFSQRHPLRGTFQERNRLITGLSCGIVLIQARLTSGTIMYAKYAGEQSRDVFVYPGPPGAADFEGSRRLISEGAKPVICGEEVLEEYGTRFAFAQSDLENASNVSKKVSTGAAEPASLEDGFSDTGCSAAQTKRRAYPEREGDEGKILSALQDGELSVSQLEDITDIPAGRLLGLLTTLELEGLAESLPGKRYRIL